MHRGAQANAVRDSEMVKGGAVVSAKDRVNGITSDVSDAIGNVTQIADRLLGVEPKAEGSSGNTVGIAPMPNGEVNELTDSLDTLYRQVTRLREQISRLYAL